MSTVAVPIADTVADLLESLGKVPAGRVRLRPTLGSATEVDLLVARERGDRLCELIDGVLVEKAMGVRESLLALVLGGLLDAHVRAENLGIVLGADAMLRLFPGVVRIPDVCFISWDRLPGRRVPDAPIPHVVPNLAVEVLSASNTAAEMERKRGEYFKAGVNLVWEADPELRSIRVYTSPGTFTELGIADSLDGGSVLPGFSLAIRAWFGELDRQG